MLLKIIKYRDISIKCSPKKKKNYLTVSIKNNLKLVYISTDCVGRPYLTAVGTLNNI